jgi:two-component system, OmpR family, catabolic regulation response regulator CreB
LGRPGARAGRLRVALLKPLILIVEDEPGIADTLQYALRTDGFEPAWCATGEEALQRIGAAAPALVILDVGLPDASGFEIFKRIRATSEVPVVFLTARSDEIDRVVGLELGADDYIAKPFSPRELVARVRAVLRRARNGKSAVDMLELGPVQVSLPAREVRLDGAEIELTPKEFDLLAYLVQHAPAVVSRDDLLERVWGFVYPGETRTVEVHVAQLRKKLGAPELIRTVRGVGYKAVA